jgi:hypothetical protein
MASPLSEEISGNFSIFEKQWPVEMSAATAALLPALDKFRQSYIRISSIQAWRTSIILGGVGEGAEAFFFEGQNDLLTSHCLARAGSFRQALKALRSAIENMYFALYYMDHPVELKKWEEGRHRIGFTELTTYFESHPSVNGHPLGLSSIEAIKSEYATLSKAVHGSAKVFRMTKDLTEIRLWESDIAAVGKWATREKTVIANFNILLTHLFSSKLQGTQNRNLRETVGLIVPKSLWSELKDAIKVTLIAG